MSSILNSSSTGTPTAPNEQVGFFAGRMFRTYLESVIPVAGPSVSFRFVSPIDFILWQQTLTLTQGALRLEIFTGTITPSGSWTTLPSIGVNRMLERPIPVYTSQVVVETGGSFTGGVPVDLMLLRTASTNGQALNVGIQATERGLPAGSYYGRFSTITGGLTVNDAAQMLYTLRWEERAL